MVISLINNAIHKTHAMDWDIVFVSEGEEKGVFTGVDILVRVLKRIFTFILQTNPAWLPIFSGFSIIIQ